MGGGSECPLQMKKGFCFFACLQRLPAPSAVLNLPARQALLHGHILS